MGFGIAAGVVAVFWGFVAVKTVHETSQSVFIGIFGAANMVVGIMAVVEACGGLS